MHTHSGVLGKHLLIQAEDRGKDLDSADKRKPEQRHCTDIHQENFLQVKRLHLCHVGHAL